MQLEAINVSKPKLRRFGFKFYTTAFLKKTVQGPVSLTQDNLNGDKQADLMNHGGNDKAVYGFSTEHHDYWKQSSVSIISILANLVKISASQD